MTSPFQYPDPSKPPTAGPGFNYPDYNARLGVESPIGQSEWDTMLQRRNQLVQNIEARLKLANLINQTDPDAALIPGQALRHSDHAANMHQVDGQNADGSPTQFQDMMTPPHQEELNRLLGAADYWGIKNADKIPPEALKKIVEARRLSAEGDRDINPAADIALTSAAAAGLGATQGLIEMAQHIPFIGHSIAANETVQKSSQWLASLNEGVQAGMTQDERKGYRIAHGLGGMLGYIVPGEMAWNAAGAAGQIGALGTTGALGRFVTSPIARAAVQGAASAWLLEGGGDQSNQEAAYKVGLGAVGGAAFTAIGEALPRVFEKVRSAFKTRSDPLNSADLGPEHDWSGPGTEDADWWFTADREIPGTPTNQRLIGSGSTPVDPPGGSQPPRGWNDDVPGSDPFQSPETIPVERRLMSPERAQIAETIHNLTEQRDVARRAMETDGLTGAGNKMALNRAMATVDSDPSLGWAVFDGKQFKAVNDTHGHQVGDQVLQNFSRALEQTAAEMNLPARIFRQGGDEFAAVVPKEQLDAFTRRATELSYQKVGGVETRLDGYASDTFGEADLALMQNKRSGIPSQITRGNLSLEQGGAGGETASWWNRLPADRQSYYGSAVVGRNYETLPAGLQDHLVHAYTRDMARTGNELMPRNPDILGMLHSRSEGFVPEVNRLGPPADFEGPDGSNNLTYQHEFNGQQITTQVHALSRRTMEVSGMEGATPDVQAAIVQDILREHPTTKSIKINGKKVSAQKFAQTMGMDDLNVDAVASARSEAAALTKQATLMESPTVVTLANNAEINESDVVIAALFQNPERINVIQGIGDVGKAIRSNVAGQVEGRIMPHQFRIVERNGQFDMLVSDGLAITPKRVQQYKDFGFFDGQQVTVNGRPLQIMKSLSGEGAKTARVYDPYSEETYIVSHDDIQPGRHTGSDVEGLAEQGDQLYGRFRQYAEDYMNREAAKMPAGSQVNTDWLSSETSSQLPRLMSSFMDHEVGSSRMSRAAVESYFNIRRVQDFRDQIPDEAADLSAASRELTRARSINPKEYSPTEELAQSRGMRVLAHEDGTATLVDQNSDLKVEVDSEQAAREFLKNFNRELPDYSPISEVPYELAGANPHAGNPGTDLDPVLESGAEGHSVLTHDAAADIEAAVAAMGGDTTPVLTQPLPSSGYSPPPQGAGPTSGGGGAGSPPPPPRSPVPPPPAGPPSPSGIPALGQQFARLRRTNPQALHQAMSRFDSAWFNLMTPFRSAVLALESDLKGVGISQGTIWKHYQDVVNNRVIAHNEAIPWHAEYADIMSQFDRPFLRNGEVMRNHLIINGQAKNAAMQAAGYTPEEVAAQHRADDFFDRYLSQLTGDPLANMRVTAYLADVRQRQAMNLPNPFADANQRLTPQLDWFRSMMKGTNMQLRQMDARMLGTKMIRAGMFEKHVEPAFQTMRSEWNQAGVPEEFKGFVNDWLEVVKTGHNPGYDVMVQGTRHMLNSFGVPITNGEVSTLASIGFSNMYRAQIGGRPDAIFRDSIQPFFTGVRIGFTPITESYKRYLSGGQNTRDMIDRGLNGGWLEKGLTRSANADVFEARLYDDQGTAILTPAQEARREMLAKLGDMTWAMTPKVLRNGLQGTVFDPLFFYTKLGEVNRLISGDAGWTLAHNAIEKYQRKLNLALGSINPTPQVLNDLMSKLMSESKAVVYPQPIQDEFRRLVGNSDWDGAKNLLGNEAANLQFRYGALENPVGIRKMGFVGKAMMQFGTFTQQYVAQMREMATTTEIPLIERAKMTARYGTVSAVIGAMTAYTGWNFSKWAWHQSLTFAGGPLFQGAYKLAQTVSGAAADLMGAPTTQGQREALRTTPGVADVLGGIASSEFPYTSTLRTMNNVYEMSRSLNPVEGTARALVTGEASMQPDIRQFLDVLDQRTMDPNAPWRGGPQPPPVYGHGQPTAAIPIAPYNPADSSTPGMNRYNSSGFPVYNSQNVDADGRVPTHRTDLPSGKEPNESWEDYEKRVIARDPKTFPASAYQASNDPNQLHPEVRDSLTSMLAAAAREGHPLRINETHRSQDRQELLFQQGRREPGSVVTWTLTSDHTTRRAADLEPVGRNAEAGWRWIQENAPKFGFNVLGSKDPGHVSMPLAGSQGPTLGSTSRGTMGAGAGGMQ